MFQKYKKFWSALLVVGISALLMVSCDINKAKDTFKNLNLVIGLKPITTTVSGVFTNAKTGALIPNVTLSFKGNGAGDVIDMFSDPLTQQKFSGGFATFGISNNITPTTVSPDSFTVVAQANGYQTAYRKIILTDTTHYSFAMTMIKTNNPPPGVNSGSNNTAQASSSGEVSQSYSVQTKAKTNAPSIASMDVPAKTVFKDADGKPLTGTLTTHMTYYSDSLKAIQQLPGGFSNGIITAGFAKISITDASGHNAAKTSKPINISFGLSPNSINPETGSSYKNGDSLKVESYNEQTGQWKYIGTAHVVKPNSTSTNQKYVKNHPMHMVAGSPTNLVQFMQDQMPRSQMEMLRPYTPHESSPFPTIKIDRKGYSGPIIVTLKGAGVGYFVQFTIPAQVNQIHWPLPNIGKIPIIPLFVTTYPSFTNADPSNILDLNTLDHIGSYTFTLAGNSNAIDVTFTMKPQCSDPSKKVHVKNLSTAVLSFKSDSDPNAPWTQIPINRNDWHFDETTNALTGATITVDGLTKGQSYTFKLNFDGKTYTKDETITGKQMTVNETISGGYCK